MRQLLALLSLFAAVVALGLWTNHLLQSSADEIIQHIEQIEDVLEKNQWDYASEQVAELEKVWKQKAKWWPIILDHQEIDNIEFSTARFKEYIAKKDAALSWGQLTELKMMIEHIPEKEAITLENIL
ncbi:MAG: DUF4363 family protein [Desulfotomaculaceae bacterium]|nr:DUF4363 family protein [Desulfotomaculaceae bacterium]